LVEPREDIWPTDPASVIRRSDDGVELATLRWGFPPAQTSSGLQIDMLGEEFRAPSASIAGSSRARAPLRSTAVSGSANDPG
jgi:putative SOS response-associated peptidase YedK